MKFIAPLSGVVFPITDVPDPVFGQKMLGDGIAIDPVNTVLTAPFSAEVTQLHDSHHALTLRHETGLELLIHIGLDTVMLKGEGFKPLVKEGDKVTAGQKLIEFDADYIAQNAISLLTMMVITSQHEDLIIKPESGAVEAAKSTILNVSFKGDDTVSNDSIEEVQNTGITVSEDITIPNPVGLHARPAAVLASVARSYTSTVTLSLNGKSSKATSITGLLGLNTKLGSIVTVTVQGDDAEKALAGVLEAIKNGLGEDVSAVTAEKGSATQQASAEEAPLIGQHNTDPMVLTGVKAAGGLAIGEVFKVDNSRPDIPEQGKGDSVEVDSLNKALTSARTELETLKSDLTTKGHDSQVEIFEAHLGLLSDPEVTDKTMEMIVRGKSASFAWHSSIAEQSAALKGLDNPLLAGRAIDLEDVGNRVLKHLLGISDQDRKLPESCILITDDITPSDIITLDMSRVIGVATREGGSTSHAAIIARSMDLPYTVGLGEQVDRINTGERVILNANKASIRLQPSDEMIAGIHNQQEAAKAKKASDLTVADQPATTVDGHNVEVVANIGSAKDARDSIELGGEGVGLLRSEFLYMDRATEPSEDEQTDVYSEIVKVLGPDRPIIIRTLDVGGDKPLQYLPLPEEENPFLGERGIRVGINRPSILRRQIRAILKASKHGRVRIMLPMIACLNEFRAVKKLVQEEQENLGIESVELGIMIEVPSAALMARQFAREVDFFSVGTNDLTQYTLAMDRGHPKMASRADAMNPAVLNLIGLAADAAHAEGKWVGVCGGLASDTDAVAMLLGLGVDELSVSVLSIPEVKAKVRELNLTACKELAQKALTLDGADDVRVLAKTWGDK
ncbi:phosphoenolpyruvate--protein phosphotransferase [Endozoicomonas sp. OPT23]|uniref:phosphoenolpyruvate--protein phosphotransferase n=1 Tax=Endozoicomonas sp. OPT23 TaxID=2072845 RepID=UPI00129B3C6E|nr:phosphoenolpyruvate--protein phosphotransferase [Endozoicomonas sp. OPT23]MRI35480.1 phosphoenolpyruvate--protein phosphotransferase [Endozoicomonas sp. OPT23]